MQQIRELPGQVVFFQAYKDFFTGFLDFKGRTTRAGYWWINIFFMGEGFSILIFVSYQLMMLIERNRAVTLKSNAVLTIAAFVGCLILTISSAAMTVRRFRDTGLRGRRTLILFAIGVCLYPVIPNQHAILIFEIIFLILSLFPTNFLTIKSNHWILNFFFRQKRTLA